MPRVPETSGVLGHTFGQKCRTSEAVALRGPRRGLQAPGRQPGRKGARYGPLTTCAAGYRGTESGDGAPASTSLVSWGPHGRQRVQSLGSLPPSHDRVVWARVWVCVWVWSGSWSGLVRVWSVWVLVGSGPVWSGSGLV